MTLALTVPLRVILAVPVVVAISEVERKSLALLLCEGNPLPLAFNPVPLGSGEREAEGLLLVRKLLLPVELKTGENVGLALTVTLTVIHEEPVVVACTSKEAVGAELALLHRVGDRERDVMAVLEKKGEGEGETLAQLQGEGVGEAAPLPLAIKPVLLEVRARAEVALMLE